MVAPPTGRGPAAGSRTLAGLRTARTLVRSRLFQRLFAVALPGLAAVAIVGLVGVLAFNEQGRQTRAMRAALEANAAADRLHAAAQEILSSLEGLNTSTAGYDPSSYAPHRQLLSDSLSALQRLDLAGFPADDQVERDHTVQALSGFLSDFAALDKTLTADPATGRTTWQLRVRPALVAIQQDAAALAQRWQDRANTSSGSLDGFLNAGRAIIVAATILAVVLSLLLMLILTQGIMRPVERLRAQMTRVGAGDLAPDPVTAGMLAVRRLPGDELEVLEAEYRQTIDRLRPLIGRIQQDATLINSSAAAISAAAAQQAGGASEQAAAITEVTVTVEQLNQTAVQIAAAASSVAAAAEQALVSANRGQEAVRDGILGMAMIKSRVNDITTRILALSEQSQRISEVIELINTIAARTHILALNAAVESAGAGEYGHRFGVVAAEVKKLAQRSVAATKEVQTIIAQIQAATAAAVMATEEGLKETDRGVALAHQSGEANEDIISMVERTAQLASAINLATQQQRTASDQVVATMREVAEVTRQAAEGSQEAACAAGELSSVAGALRGVARGFTLGPPPAGVAPDGERAGLRPVPSPAPQPAGVIEGP